jgi:chromatin segregation and condensation protein Rec8/ScpA/Scc1 (kleisin family)
MKALNRKERQKAQWTIALLFVPIIAIAAIGMVLHFKVMALQGGDLEQKEQRYNLMLEAQAKKGEMVDDLIRGLQELRDSSKSFVEHQNAQKAIRSNLIAMQKIQPVIPDTQDVKIRAIPAIYDSLSADILLVQSTRDSIKTCDEQIKTQTFQLQQCLDALQQNLEEKQKNGK